MVKRWATAVVFAAGLICGTAAAEEVVTEYEGRHFVAELTQAPGKTVADNLLLVVHGTLSHKDSELIVAFREAMKQRGVNTLAINLSLGFDARRGPVDCTLPQVHYHREALLDIGVWLTWAVEHGAKKVDLFGHSRGGNQAAWYAFERPRVDLVGKVALLAPMTWDKDRESAEYRQRYGHGYDDTLKIAEEMVKYTRKREFLPEPVDFLYCPKAKVNAESFFEYYSDDQRKDTPSILRGVDRKVLIVMGTKDKVVPDLPAKLAGRKLPHVTVRTIDGADHFFRDLYMDDVADAVAEFLK